MRLREIMTPGVVTAALDDGVLEVARLMRDRGVGSVVLCDHSGGAAAMVTDRDLAVRALADECSHAEAVSRHASRPLISADADADLSEAAATMVGHRIRRLPVLDRGELVGIVTLDDIAVRTGDLDVARQMTHDVIEGAMPQFFFHERG